MKVEKIMTDKVISVNTDTKIAEVAYFLSKYRIHALPVLDENKQVAGIITESDLFIKNDPNKNMISYIEFLENTKASTKEKINAYSEEPARSIMTINPTTVRPDTDVKELIKIIKEKKLFSVPVVDNNSRLVGIVTMADLIQIF